MKYLIRLSGFVAVSLLCVALWRPLSVHAAADSLYLTPTPQTVIYGATISETIHEDSGTDAINAVQANLSYPASQLKVLTISAVTGWSEAQNDTSTPGTILFAAFPSPAGATLTGDQAVATVVFQVIGLGTPTVSFGGGCALIRASDTTNILSSTVGATITINSDHLVPGQTMLAGQYIYSQNVFYVLVMQGDGNLVLYTGSKPLWNSGTSGTGADRVVMQTDGNLVIYTPGGRPVWASRTDGKGQSSLYMQDDGNAVVYTNSGAPTWSSITAGHPVFTYFGSDQLTNNQTLHQGQYLRSADGRHGLLMQPDGNLVLYGLGYHVLWASYTNGKGASFVAMQSDGNLVIYTAANKPLWATVTAGRGVSSAVVQNDGNFVVYASSTPTWASGTDGKI